MAGNDVIVVIGDSRLTTGFRLAGLSETVVAEGKAAERSLEEQMARPEVGVIVTTEKILSEADWRLRKRIEGAARPTVVTVPDVSGVSYEGESLRALVKRALGFELVK